jgi:hypothetical protein
MVIGLKMRGPRDRTRVNVNETWEVDCWTREFGCTSYELHEAVKMAGPMADNVQAYLKRKGWHK